MLKCMKPFWVNPSSRNHLVSFEKARRLNAGLFFLNRGCPYFSFLHLLQARSNCHCETIPPQRKAKQSGGSGSYRRVPHTDCRVAPNKPGLLAMTQWLNMLNGFVIPAQAGIHVSGLQKREIQQQIPSIKLRTSGLTFEQT